jgi:hypothetical protein
LPGFNLDKIFLREILLTNVGILEFYACPARSVEDAPARKGMVIIASCQPGIVTGKWSFDHASDHHRQRWHKKVGERRCGETIHAHPHDMSFDNIPMPTKAKASKREVIEPNKDDKRFVRRKSDGTFGKTVAVGKSLSADSRTKANKKVPKGQGDRGDTKRQTSGDSRRA